MGYAALRLCIGGRNHEIIANFLPIPLHKLFSVIVVKGLWYSYVFYKTLSGSWGFSFGPNGISHAKAQIIRKDLTTS